MALSLQQLQCPCTGSSAINHEAKRAISEQVAFEWQYIESQLTHVLAGNTMTWMDLIETEVIPKLHEHATSTEIVLKLAMTWKDAMPS